MDDKVDLPPGEAEELHHLRAALASVSEAVVTISLAGRVTFINPAAEALTGWSKRSALGQPVKAVFVLLDSAPETAPGEAMGAPRRALLRGEAGRQVVIEYSAAGLHDSTGQLTGTIFSFRDISRRRAAELALQSSEENLLANEYALFQEKERAQVTLNSIGDAVISTDFRGRVSFLNAVAERMTGCTQLEAAGRKIDEVFVVIDAASRQPMRCPTMTAIIENVRVDLAAGCSLLQKDGTTVAVEGSAAPIHDKSGGVSGAVMVARDVTAARDLSEKLARLALHDNLTDLPNRVLFRDRLDQALVRAHRSGGSVAVLFVDLDRFKPINDSLGHAAGDQVLQAVARRLRTCVRNSDTVCRYGGDEFLILMADVPDEPALSMYADKIRCAFEAPYQLAGRDIYVTASIGIAASPRDCGDAVTLLKYADIAMYHAKCAGRNKYACFNPEMLSEE